MRVSFFPKSKNMFYRKETVAWAIGIHSQNNQIQTLDINPSIVSRIVYEQIESDYSDNLITLEEYQIRMSELSSMYSVN